MAVTIRAGYRGGEVEVTVDHGYTYTVMDPYNTEETLAELDEAVLRVRQAIRSEETE